MKFTRDGLLTAILVVAALFVGSFIVDRVPSSDSVFTETPFVRTGVLGEPIRLRTAEVTVLDVKAAKRIELYREVAASAGVFLVFEVVWSPIGAPSSLMGFAPAVVAADGRVFGGTQVLINNCGPAQPGIPVTCQLPVEIAADALEGAHLLVPAAGSIHASDDLADLDLGIDAVLAEKLAGTNLQIKLQETTAVQR